MKNINMTYYSRFIAKDWGKEANVAICPSGKDPRRGGFTLLEMLVVVIIIGILASIALPAYQRSVWQSRNAELKSIVKTVRQAADRYYMKTGRPPTSFQALDVVIPGTYSQGVKNNNFTQANNVCGVGNLGNGSVLTGKNYQIVLSNTDASLSTNVTAVWIKGPYKCGGFFFSKTAERMQCREFNGSEAYGKFCTETEGLITTPVQGDGTAIYDMP